MKKIALLIFLSLFIKSSFATWTSMGSPGGTIRTLCVHNGELYAGGDFSGLVKKWNNSNGTWSVVGNLTGTRVNALYSYNGTLYAGGLFPVAGTSGNVAKLSGNSWVASGSGLGGDGGSEVKAFCFFYTNLYAGGIFNLSGSTPVVNVAKLNGSNWVQAGGTGGPSKCTGGVYAMIVYNSVLHVGGEGTAPFVNKLSAGGSWSELAAGGPSNGSGVYAFGVLKYNTSQNQPTLFIGGKFGGNGAFQNTMALLNDVQWGTVSGFSTGTNDQINCFTSSADNSTGIIYAGGVFSYTGTHASTNIAKRINGTTAVWDSAGSPSFNGSIRALCFYNGYLVAGGDFSSPGSNVSRYATAVGVNELQENIILNSIYPNPVIREAMLKVQTKNKLQQPELRMMDASGNEVENHSVLNSFDPATHAVDFRIDREGLASGIYYYFVLDKESTVASGKMIIE